MRYILLSGLVLLLFSCKSTQIENKMTFAENPVVAHRGAWKAKALPENSIAALREAIRLGCVGSEFDVRMTKDEVLIVTHDATYNDLIIEESTYSKLAETKLANGETLPTLEDYIKAGLVDNPSTGLVVELKPSKTPGFNELMAVKAMETIDRLNAKAHVLTYISFSYAILKKIKQIDSNAQVQYLDGSKNPDQLENDQILGMDYYISAFKNNPTWIAQAKAKNIKLNVWTVNKESDMNWFLDREFDFITTNEPELLFDLMEKKSQSRWNLVWSDEFDGNELDRSKWSYETGLVRNQEKQFYTDTTENVRISNNELIIEAHKATIENPAYVSVSVKDWRKNGKVANYTSGSITTRGKAAWKYGRIELRGKLPEGKGVWPAFWMMGDDLPDAKWPDRGEIDIMEYVGFEPDSIFGTIHTAAYNHMIGTQRGKKIAIDNPQENYHVYAIEWTPDSIDFFLDDVIYNHIENEHKTTAEWPFDQQFFLKINLAIGGMLGGQKGIDDSVFPQRLTVDYVRVYQEDRL